jgi:pyruvate dehydrogenase E2 component (dihydrolipoamide acetyltransferase)
MAFDTIEKLPTWRRLALSSWRASDDPTIYGWMDIDVSRLQTYLTELRRTSGERVTLTHAVGKAAAIAFAQNPECNGVVSLGRLRKRRSVDVFFSVAIGDGKNLAGSKIERADELDVVEIAQRLNDSVNRIRSRGDSQLQKSQRTLARLPALALGPAMRASAALMFDLDLDLERWGVPYDPFGSVIVTNVGVLGIEQASRRSSRRGARRRCSRSGRCVTRSSRSTACPRSGPC